MDLKRAWRNGFLISVVFALPLSDLYNFQQSNLIANGSSSKKPVQQARNCAGVDCDGFEFGTNDNGAIDTEDRELAIPRDSLSSRMLESSGSQSANLRNAALRFSPQDILQSDLTGEENPNVPDDIRQVIDMDIGSLASLAYDFGGSTSFAPGHGGPFAPAGFTGGNSDAASGSLNALSDAGESSTITEQDISGDSDTLQNVPELSSLALMTIGTISVAALFHSRRPKPR